MGFSDRGYVVLLRVKSILGLRIFCTRVLTSTVVFSTQAVVLGCVS